jgi:hypothetical protein
MSPQQFFNEEQLASVESEPILNSVFLLVGGCAEMVAPLDVFMSIALFDGSSELILIQAVNLRNESFGNGALNDEVYGSDCGRCPVFIHDLP